MKINSVSITSLTSLDFEVKGAKPITIFRGKHSALALDLIREVIGESNSNTNPNNVDNGHFIIHTDVDMDGKSYSVCYIRSADFLGDNRIAVNFHPDSIEYSEEDTREFLKKRNEINKDNRPVFIYPSALGERNNVTAFIRALSGAGSQVFLAIPEEFSEIEHDNITNVFVN